ncbi:MULTISPECIES: hypothetical protein [Brasilonema]|nr:MULTISPECIES: hypothetical protein [Brasilonema]
MKNRFVSQIRVQQDIFSLLGRSLILNIEYVESFVIPKRAFI